MAHDLTRNPLEPSLNPPHDTKHGNKTTCITIQIHRMILYMIQGCRYLRRSTDRWTLSKNSTTRLEDSKVWRKAGLLWECSITITYIQGSYLYPVLTRLLMDYEHNIWYLINAQMQMPIYPCVPSFCSGHVTTRSHESSANSPFAERERTADRRYFCRILWRNLSLPNGICYQVRPTNQPPSCTNFCC
jgi:hypothetical protein